MRSAHTGFIIIIDVVDALEDFFLGRTADTVDQLHSLGLAGEIAVLVLQGDTELRQEFTFQVRLLLWAHALKGELRWGSCGRKEKKRSIKCKRSLSRPAVGGARLR